MAGTIKADVVVTYPNEEGEWSTLKLSSFEADYLIRALNLAMPKGNDPERWARVIENPQAYAS